MNFKLSKQNYINIQIALFICPINTFLSLDDTLLSCRVIEDKEKWCTFNFVQCIWLFNTAYIE